LRRTALDEKGTVVKLDKHKILALLAEADTRWYNNHSGQFKYREHLEFVAEHVTTNYHRELKKERRQERQIG
jgi:hypothetical protein